MAKRLLDFDPLTGVRTYHEYDHGSQNTLISQEQDVSKVLQYTKRLANDPDYKRRGIKTDWYHFATVPNAVIMELRIKHNLDVFNDDDLPKIEQIIQRDYPKLLTVDRI